MDRTHFYAQLQRGKGLDYEVYLQTAALLQCQKPFDAPCNPDELQFQIVHHAAKKRKDARVAREYEVAVPHEFSALLGGRPLEVTGCDFKCAPG